MWHNKVDTEPLVMQLKIRLTGHASVPIRTHHIVGALEELFKALGHSWPGHGWGPKEDRVQEISEELLRDERSRTDYRGLYKTRTCFLILCVVAFCAQSERLAAALGGFIEDRAHRIVEDENSICLAEWCLGLCELRNLIPSWKLQRLTERLSDAGSGILDDWDDLPYYGYIPRHRGRPRLALPGLPGWDPRAFSAPAIRRRRSLDDLRVVRPLRSACPSPRRIGMKDYFDDAQSIQYQQMVQAVELADVNLRLKQLEYSW